MYKEFCILLPIFNESKMKYNKLSLTLTDVSLGPDQFITWWTQRLQSYANCSWNIDLASMPSEQKIIVP